MRNLFILILFSILVSCESNDEIDFDQPNIIFIEVDDLTAKYLKVFGADFPSAPHIDTLAMNGVVFDNAVVQGVRCTPSRNSLITGLYPHQLNLYHNLDLIALPKNIWTFPKALQKEGYKTIWIGKNHLLPNYEGLNAKNPVELNNTLLKIEMGFDDVFQSKGRAMLFKKAKDDYENNGEWIAGVDAYGDFLFENNLLNIFVEEGGNKPTSLDPNTEYIDGFFTSLAIDKIESLENEDPFFLWLNLSGPHEPFDPPKKYFDGIRIIDIPKIIEPNEEKFKIPKELIDRNNHLSKNATIDYRKRYLASIRYMDDQVGRLLNFINTSRIKDNTVIVFFSDHGIMTGDHDILGKSTLFKEVLNPSLIISWPEHFEPKRELTTVELIDLGKTVLDLAGADETEMTKRNSGNSLLPLLTNKGKFEGDGLGFSEIRGITSVYNGKFKYIDHPDTPLLFNLKKDPDEINNLYKSNRKRASTMKQELLKFRSNTEPLPYTKRGEPIVEIEIPEGMVLIKGDSTQIGSDYENTDESPISEMYIKAFYMDKHPVTVKQFREFINETQYITEAEQFGNGGVFDFETGEWLLKDGAYWEYPQGRDFPMAEDDHPVTQVSWNDANAYCKWAGKRLPTEFEWEHAARGGGKIKDRLYPWWTNYLKDKNGNYMANVWQGAFPVYNSVDDGYKLTSPVGKFGETSLGLQDMAGNVWEWCSNWKIPYDQELKDYQPDERSEKAQRGGSFLCDPKVCHGYRVSGRSGSTPETSLMNVGFRCVKDVEEI